MAQLFPSWAQIDRLKKQPTNGERHLLTFLDQHLSDEYEIYFQPFLNGDRPDIVVMRKGSGVLIIEVKDWNLNLYSVKGEDQWTVGPEQRPVLSPIEQVRGYKDKLFKLHIPGLVDRNQQDSKCFGVVAVALYFYGHQEQEASRLCAAAGKHLEILGDDSLTERRLRGLLHNRYLDRPSRYFDEDLYTQFKRYLQPPVHALEEGREIVYKPKQKALIESRPVEQKIRGVAGSGKTKVLAKRAVNAHLRTGSRVLVLTYNITLVNYIHDRISEVRETFGWEQFYIMNYHLFFKLEANHHEIPLRGGDFEEQLADVDFFARVEEETDRYDAIFIDEIQDYETAWIKIVKRYFLKEGGEFVVFGDEKQNIYDRKLESDKKTNTTIPGRWNELTDSFRSNPKIMDLAVRFQQNFLREKYDRDQVDLVEQPELFGQPSYLKTIDLPLSAGPWDLFQRINQIVRQLNLHPNDVTIVAPSYPVLRELDYLFRTINHEKTTAAFASKEVCDQLVQKHGGKKEAKPFIKEEDRPHKFNFWANAGTMKLASIHSFKGWEVHTLFLVLEPEPVGSESFNPELIYTAITRCRQNLFVLNRGNQTYHQFFQEMNDLHAAFRQSGGGT